MRRWFVTGTDTGCGKTVVSVALARRLVAEGRRVACLKPVASGCERTAEGLRNEDALALMASANAGQGYDEVNPFAYEPAVAPHLAARAAGRPVDFDAIAALADRCTADELVVEGAGGWLVPLEDRAGGRTMADLAARLDAGVILVVGMRLGCLNHALLSARQALAGGARLVGWVANRVDPAMDLAAENLDTLDRWMPVPRLARMPWNPSDDSAFPLEWEEAGISAFDLCANCARL